VEGMRSKTWSIREGGESVWKKHALTFPAFKKPRERANLQSGAQLLVRENRMKGTIEGGKHLVLIGIEGRGNRRAVANGPISETLPDDCSSGRRRTRVTGGGGAKL